MAEPELPQITDDMLAPVPPATNVLQDWRDALRVLRANSTTLKSLAAREDLARAQSRQALSGALPTLTGDARVNYQLLKGDYTAVDLPGTINSIRNDPVNGGIVTTTSRIPDPALTWQAGLGLRVPVLALDTWHRRGTAEAAIDVAKLNTKASERILAGLVADSVVAAILSERAAEVSRVSLESALSSLDLYKRRAALGAASSIDVLRIEQEVSLSRAQVVAANDAVLRARETLGTTLGSSEPYGVTPNISLDTMAQDAKNTCRRTDDVMQRSDVLAAQGSVSLSKRNESEVSKTYWPTLDAVSNLTYWDPESGINNQHVTWSVGGVLSWTLYDGGLRYGTKEQRVAETRIAQEQLNDAKRQARMEVTQAFRNLKVSQNQLVIAARTREIAAETARLSKVAYLNGSGTTFDLVDTAQKQRSAELDYTIREFEVLRAKIAAVLALSNCDV